MKLIEFKIENKHVLIERNLIGTETLSIDDKVINKKWNLFTTQHTFKLNDTDYNIEYVYKDGWKKFIGKPIFQLTSNKNVIAEQQVDNKPYLAFQIGLGLIVTYALISLLFIFIESAKRGFVFNAH
ncbi:MAG: hypothetical protein ABJM06_09495 [Gilvibacter sp.]